MTTDPFAHDDAAYVLGALGHVERREFEEHLAECPTCTRAVADLAGMPAMLAQVDETAFAGPDSAPPLPDTLLPRLLEEVRRRRRRLRLLAVAGAGAAAAVLAVIAGFLLLGGPSPNERAPVPQAMVQVHQRVMSATVSMEQVAWGTRMQVTCRYADGDWGGRAPAYALVVRTRDGGREQVATWRAVPGTEARLEAATAADPSQITAVDVVLTGTGRRVLTLAPHHA